MAGAAPLRSWSMRLHRWVALALGAWFALLGLSGTVLVWHAEIDRALNPAWFAPLDDCPRPAPPAPVATALALHAAASAAPAVQVIAPDRPGAAYLVADTGAGGRRVQHFVDVACGRYLGAREWGRPRLGRAHAVPALYELHRSLLSGDAGHVLVGLVGLSLLATAITGALNAWPRTGSRAAWRRTLTVKAGTGARRRWYDLHRAAGMWVLPFLLLMGLSGAYLCFPKQARALVGAALPMTPERTAPRMSAGPAARAVAPDRLVAAARAHWPGARWSRLQLPSQPGGGFEVRLLQPGEPRRDTGDTRVRFDAHGHLTDTRDPLRAPAGDTLVAWLFPLHSGEALGLPGRLAWTLSGLVPALLFATGTWLWWQRRRARSSAAERPQAPARPSSLDPSHARDGALVAAACPARTSTGRDHGPAAPGPRPAP